MLYIFIIQVVQILIIIALGFYINHLNSYSKEKGKNLATKEDIEEITLKVESIKSEILYSSQVKINMITEERDSVVNCYEKYHKWHYAILERTDSSFKDYNGLKENLEVVRHEYTLALARMKIFVSNNRLLELAEEIRLKTFEFQGMRIHLVIQEQLSQLKDEDTTKVDILEKREKETYYELVPLVQDYQKQVNKHLQELYRK